MRAAASKPPGDGPSLTPPEAGPGGYWEIFFAEHALPITMPATVPESRVRALCEALGVPYRLRPPLH